MSRLFVSKLSEDQLVYDLFMFGDPPPPPSTLKTWILFEIDDVRYCLYMTCDFWKIRRQIGRLSLGLRPNGLENLSERLKTIFHLNEFIPAGMDWRTLTVKKYLQKIKERKTYFVK